MNKILLTFLIFFIGISTAFAERIELNIPVVNYVRYNVLSERTNLDFATGALFSPLEAGFEVISNSPENTSVRFDVLTTTTSGEINAIKVKNNKNSGKCALANVVEIPSSSSVKQAIKSSTNPSKNPNVIGYNIKFVDATDSSNPKYRNSENAVIATLDDEEYYKYYKVLVSNNSSQLSKTFDRTYDEAGDYSLTIYCTISSN